MRSYVSDFGEHPELMHMRVAMPFNLHTYNAFQPSDVSNQLALLPVPLPVALASRRDRLIHCTESMRRVKRGCQPALAVKAIKSLSRLPMSVMRRLWSRVASSASALLSNVAGPTNLVSIGGIPVTCIYVFPPCDVHNTVNVAIFSYNGSFFVSVSGDAERLKYPQKLLDYYSDEVIALLDMADLEPAVQTNTS